LASDFHLFFPFPFFLRGFLVAEVSQSFLVPPPPLWVFAAGLGSFFLFAAKGQFVSIGHHVTGRFRRPPRCLCKRVLPLFLVTVAADAPFTTQLQAAGLLVPPLPFFSPQPCVSWLSSSRNWVKPVLSLSVPVFSDFSRHTSTQLWIPSSFCSWFSLADFSWRELSSKVIQSFSFPFPPLLHLAFPTLPLTFHHNFCNV